MVKQRRLFRYLCALSLCALAVFVSPACDTAPPSKNPPAKPAEAPRRVAAPPVQPVTRTPSATMPGGLGDRAERGRAQVRDEVVVPSNVTGGLAADDAKMETDGKLGTSQTGKRAGKGAGAGNEKEKAKRQLDAVMMDE